MDDRSLPRIYTRTGDAGETGLFDGTRVSKADARVDAYGDVDELSAWLGLAHARLAPSDLADLVEGIQRDLFAVGAQLADPRHRIAPRVEKSRIDPDRVRELEASIDVLEAPLTPLRRFILAGGSEAGAVLHLARAVCRRAERRVVALGGEQVDPIVLEYLNRLSDLLFVMARAANARAGVSEIEW
jgi:cob(I)alamin adenosyltransferase